MALNLNNVSLKITAGTVRQFPRSATPQIALAGRSNVGKSSLINTLLGRRALARVSSAPGKTITVNFYDVDGKLFLVDLPGYGYAKRPQEDKARWSELTDGYFTNNPSAHRLRRSVCRSCHESRQVAIKKGAHRGNGKDTFLPRDPARHTCDTLLLGKQRGKRRALAPDIGRGR